MRRGFVSLALALLTALAVVSTTSEAQAQPTPCTGRVCPDQAMPSATVGGAFLGAELVIIVEGLVGVRNRWIMLGSGAVGAIAGGIGGYFAGAAIDASVVAGGNTTMPIIGAFMLVAGLGLIIPTSLVFVGSTMYRPDESNDRPDDNAPAAQPLEESTGEGAPASSTGTGGATDAAPAAGSTTTTTTTTTTPSGGGGGRGGRRPMRHVEPQALLNFAPRSFAIGIPTVNVMRSYSLEETRQYGLSNMSEVNIPLVRGVF